MDFGGLGGIMDGRSVNEKDLFEVSVRDYLGQQMKEDPELCMQVYASITNQDWQHKDGHTAGYSFRSAGDLIAAILGEGNYLDWYCSSPEGVVHERVAEALGRAGWTPIEE